jgi:hypothetical protein
MPDMKRNGKVNAMDRTPTTTPTISASITKATILCTQYSCATGSLITLSMPLRLPPVGAEAAPFPATGVPHLGQKAASSSKAFPHFVQNATPLTPLAACSSGEYKAGAQITA